jgi:hypothetical protein
MNTFQYILAAFIDFSHTEIMENKYLAKCFAYLNMLTVVQFCTSSGIAYACCRICKTLATATMSLYPSHFFTQFHQLSSTPVDAHLSSHCQTFFLFST